MPVLGVIPARLGSTRLPRKPLQLLGGVPLVLRVTERAVSLGCFDEVVIATDSADIARVVEGAGYRAVLTSPAHSSGTERVAEAAARPEFLRFDLIVNVQGDEPFLAEDAVAGAIARVRQGDQVGTAAAPLSADSAADPSRVKVVFDAAGRALYFSRAAIPALRDRSAPSDGLYWQHIGLYAFRPDTLRAWVALPPTRLEAAEQLEQLRPLHHGFHFGIARLRASALPGIDTPEDLRRAESHWHDTQGVTT
jgi:3-deoxy-manno-octulosonate cytidylyltransferase (CMP-KDO synthetase)